MAGAFSETFGEAGTASVFFGGEWWLVGLYILLIFIAFLMAYKVNSSGILVVLVLGLLMTGVYQLFAIDEQILQTILFIIFIFVGYMTYIFFSR